MLSILILGALLTMTAAWALYKFAMGSTHALAYALLVPGLGAYHALLMLIGERRLPLLEHLGLPFGELSSLTAGKSLGNLIEVPLAAAVGVIAAVALARRVRRGDPNEHAGQIVIGCYLVATLLYFVAPMLPE